MDSIPAPDVPPFQTKTDLHNDRSPRFRTRTLQQKRVVLQKEKIIKKNSSPLLHWSCRRRLSDRQFPIRKAKCAEDQNAQKHLGDGHRPIVKHQLWHASRW